MGKGDNIMPKICDRSPCDGLLEALGVYIYGARGKFMLVFNREDKQETVGETEINYCPFCGTRLEIITNKDDT